MKKKGKSNKPQAVKAAVIAKSVGGKSNSQIAQDLNISRPTVARILDEAELTSLVAEGKTGIYQLIGKSVKALERALDKGDTSEAKMILRSVGVLPNEENAGSNNVTFSIGVIAQQQAEKNAPSRDHAGQTVRK
jgi:hypothetical protein